MTPILQNPPVENNRSSLKIATPPSQRKQSTFLDRIVQKDMGELVREIGFSSSVFMLFGLPTRRLPDNPFVWEKKNSICSVQLTRHPRFEIPYGCYARMNQIFIDTEVKTKATNIIDVGRSFSDYVGRLGYHDGKANRALIRQLVNYITTTIRIEPKNAAAENKAWDFKGIQALVSRQYDISFDVRNPDQLMMGKGLIRLDEEYARYIFEHSAPLDMTIVNLFKRNPLGLDFYRYLAYRNNELNREISFPDRFLFEQLGAETEHKKLRQRLRGLLKMIQCYWPVQAKLEDGYFVLAPSDPIVPKIRKSTTELRLIHNLDDVG